MVGWVPQGPKQHRRLPRCGGVGSSRSTRGGKAEDGRALAEIPEALMLGSAEGLRPRVPEVVTEIAERPPAVMETPEAVDRGIPNRPTS